MCAETGVETRWKWRAVALGIHYLSRVGRQSNALFAILLSDKREDFAQFCQSCFSRIHQRIAAGNRWNLGNPRTVLLPVTNRLVVLYFHMQLQNYTLELTSAARHPVLGLGERRTRASR